MIHGTYQEWESNSILVERSSFKNGKFDGISRSWYRNGKIMSECKYKNGILEGFYMRWNMNGELIHNNFIKPNFY
jgi:antitoxin component YwqK of YwqJK toxin-antitoxin module